MGTGKNIIRLILVIIIIGLLILLGIRFFRKKETTVEVFTKVSLDEYVELFKSKDKSVIYISSKNEFSKEYENNLTEFLKQSKKKIYYLNLSELKDEQIITFMNANELTQDSYIDPMILVITDGEVEDKILGVTSKSELLKFLDKNVN